MNYTKTLQKKDLKKFSEDEITPELKEAINLSTRHFVKTVLFNYLLKDLMKLFMDDEQELDNLIKLLVNILINGTSKFN